MEMVQVERDWRLQERRLSVIARHGVRSREEVTDCSCNLNWGEEGDPSDFTSSWDKSLKRKGVCKTFPYKCEKEIVRTSDFILGTSPPLQSTNHVGSVPTTQTFSRFCGKSCSPLSGNAKMLSLKKASAFIQTSQKSLWLLKMLSAEKSPGCLDKTPTGSNLNSQV